MGLSKYMYELDLFFSIYTFDIAKSRLPGLFYVNSCDEVSSLI